MVTNFIQEGLLMPPHPPTASSHPAYFTEAAGGLEVKWQ